MIWKIGGESLSLPLDLWKLLLIATRLRFAVVSDTFLKTMQR